MPNEPVYVIFGATSPVGEAITTRLNACSDAYRIFSFGSDKVNIALPEHIKPLLEYIKPTVAINCYGLDEEDICEDAKEGAFNINCCGPRILAEGCKKYGSKLVHISSSGVFNGKKATPYIERDAARPINVLGESKLQGENAIRNTCDNWLIIRPGWLFHYVNGTCIANWLTLADSKREVPFLEGQYGSPTYAPDLADAIVELIAKDEKGLFHITNAGEATRKELVETTLSLANAQIRTIPVKAETQSFWKAPLPLRTTLSTNKYDKVIGKPLRSWESALKHCLFIMRRYQ